MLASLSPDLVGSAWQNVLSWLPPNLDAMAKDAFGFRRRGLIQAAADVLRLGLAYSVLDFSLRSSATWLVTHGLGDISDVAVLGRLRRAQPFFAQVLGSLLTTRIQFPSDNGLKYRVRLIDATCVSQPGSKGADWRLHASYDVARGVIDNIELTDGTGGENLSRAAACPGDLIVGDRGYAHASRMLELLAENIHFLVRIGHSAVPLVDARGAVFDPVAHASRVLARLGPEPRVEETTVFLRDDVNRQYPLRLLIVRKPDDAARTDRVKITREVGRKGKQPMQRTLDAAAYAFLLTSVPAGDASAELLADLYRVRWQVELNFKRWKSIFDLDRLRADDPDLVRAYIYAKLIAAALSDTITRGARVFSPWGVAPLRFRLAHRRLGPSLSASPADAGRTVAGIWVGSRP